MKKLKKFLILKIVVLLVILIWVVNFFILFFYWGQMQAWLKWAISLYQFVVVSDIRIFKVPFMTEEEFTSLSLH